MKKMKAMHQLEHIQIVQLERPSAPDFFFTIYQSIRKQQKERAPSYRILLPFLHII